MKIEWKKLVGAVAPTLATALGGPLAGAAVGAISQSILGREDGTEAEIAEVIAAGKPEVLLKLKEADHAFKAKMGELGVKLEEINASDRASARAREVQTQDKTPKILATVVVVGFFAVLVTMMFVDLAEAVKEPSLILLGALSAAFGAVMNYYFGSSSGSNQKNAILSEAMRK